MTNEPSLPCNSKKPVSHRLNVTYGSSFRKLGAARLAVSGGKDMLGAYSRATFIYTHITARLLFVEYIKQSGLSLEQM
jgi:hypothetical protein